MSAVDGKENKDPEEVNKEVVDGDAVDNKPALIERQDTQNEQAPIVIALDGSEEAEHAVKWYINKIHKTGNKIVFVHCIELPEMNLNQAQLSGISGKQGGGKTATGSLHMSPGVLAQMWKEEEQKTKTLEEKMKALLKEKGLKGILRTATGKPGETIVRIAEEERAEMVVVGTRGTGKVRRTILGSVSDYLVHHAHCPVVVCRHPDTILRQQMRRRHSSASSDGNKSRHTSGDSYRSRNASGEEGEKKTTRSRKWSGEFFKFTRSFSQNSDNAE